VRNQFGFSAIVFTLVAICFFTIGFGGVHHQIDVKYGACESHYRKYELKPFLTPLLCLTGKLKPCGDFAEHRNMLVHIQMLECLCRDPSGQAFALREYTSEYFTNSGLGNDPNAICQARPRTHSL